MALYHGHQKCSLGPEAISHPPHLIPPPKGLRTDGPSLWTEHFCQQLMMDSPSRGLGKPISSWHLDRYLQASGTNAQVRRLLQGFRTQNVIRNQWRLNWTIFSPETGWYLTSVHSLMHSFIQLARGSCPLHKEERDRSCP